MMRAAKSSKVIQKILAFILIISFVAFLLFPFYWMFVTSVKPNEELFTGIVTYWPKNFTTKAYENLFRSYDFLSPMLNSLFVSVITTIISLVVSVMAAFAFARYEFPGRKILMMLFLTNNMFPTVLLLISLFTIINRMGILYTPWALIVSYSSFTIPFSLWLINGYMSDMPLEIEEAAMIDGCNRGLAFILVELPMLIPSIISCGVYILMNAWNEYTFAVMFTNENNRTISVALKNLVGQLGVQWDLMTAGGIIAVLPICIMFFFAQKRLVAGLTAGAVKG